MGTRGWRPIYARHLAFAEVKIELPPPIPRKREGPPKHSEGKQPRVESQATANSATSGRTTERLDEDRGPEAPEALKREQNPPVGEAAHRVSPPPVPPPRSPEEPGPEQAPTPTAPLVGNKIGNGVTWRLFGYVTGAVLCFLVVFAILSSLRSSSRTAAGNSSQTALAQSIRKIHVTVTGLGGKPASHRKVHLIGLSRKSMRPSEDSKDFLPNWDFETDEQGKCVVLLGSFNGYENKEGMPGWGMYALVVDRGPGDAGAVSQRFIFEKNEEASRASAAVADEWDEPLSVRDRDTDLRLPIVRGITLEGRILDYWHPDKPLAGIKVVSNNDLHVKAILVAAAKFSKTPWSRMKMAGSVSSISIQSASTLVSVVRTAFVVKVFGLRLRLEESGRMWLATSSLLRKTRLCSVLKFRRLPDQHFVTGGKLLTRKGRPFRERR
jgi:hypothetical protein